MHYSIGYTAGTFDLFHVGHLILLENAKRFCDELIVGVNSDELVNEYKNKRPIIPEKDRVRIIRSLRVVDKALIVHSLDKVEAHGKLGFEVVFIGSDWKGNERWIQTEKDLAKFGVQVQYLPYTKSISSTQLAATLNKADNK